MSSSLRISPTKSKPLSEPPGSSQETVYAPPEDEGEATLNMSAAPNTYSPGAVIAQKYELIRKLGEGGMGAVWVARNVALDAHVALKLIRAEVSRNVPGIQGRLLQEARAAASLGHPAIIRVFDFGTTERGDPFIAMELLHGENLAHLLQRRSKVGAVRAVQTLLPIIDALATAHATGIIHRDLKPDNVFISRETGGRLQPKLLDFGIAKLEHNVSPHLTREGTVLGSPAFMSPEQARGTVDIDARSDIWSVCVVLYLLMTGVRPFVAENSNALLWSIVEDPPVPFADLGVTEPELWPIIRRGLEKKREDRWQEMSDLGKALAEWLVSKGVEEDICHASLRARWLEPKRRKEGDVLHSFFPSDPPEIEEKTAPQTHGVAATLSSTDSSSGVHLSAPAPAPIRAVVPQAAPQAGGIEPTAERRPWKRRALIGIAPIVLFAIAIFARSAFRSRHVTSDAAPVGGTEAKGAVATPSEARPAATPTDSAPLAGGTNAPPAANPATGASPEPPAAVSPPPTVSPPATRSPQDRAKPGRRAPKRRPPT